MLRSRITPLVAAALLLAPRALLACPMCFDPRAENRVAFATTAVAMTLLPLGMVGALALWLRRRARALKQEGTDQNPDPPPAS